MKKITLIALIFLLFFLPYTSFAGNCDRPDDRAADGSRCGGRSAESRSGGSW